MFNNLRKKLYISKMYLLYIRGLKEGKIVPFDDEFYEKMNYTFFNCIPVSMHIRYFMPTIGPGKCYDRSLFMFFCFDDAVLVRAKNKDLELKYGKENAGHGWIEIGDYVYDPSLMMRFSKDLYYEIFSPTNISKTTKEDYQKVSGSYYDDVRNTSIKDFQPGGRKRTDLAITIPLVKGIADLSSNDKLKKELNDYLTLIQYDENQVYEELISKSDFQLQKH